MKISDIEVKTFVNSDFEENLFVVFVKGGKECLMIDPGMEPGEAIAFIKEKGLTPKGVLITHGHYDHIAGVDRVKAEWPDVPVMISEIDRPKMTNPAGNLSAHFGFPVTTKDADRAIANGEFLTIAGITLRAILVPGHSSGHLVYRIDGEDGTILFVGDVIFAGSIGRTDFPDGNMDHLLWGIRKYLLPLPDDTVFYTGHGPATTAGQEKRYNQGR